MKREQVTSREELEWKLRSEGTSLERERRTFMQKTISQQWIHQKVKPDDEITHEEMLAWYQAHLREFEKPPRVRWEELMVRVSKYPSNEAAYAALAAMGNDVALAGRPLAEVAKVRSDGPTAAEGGARDWTNQGALAAEQLDQALFALPQGQLSRILESKTGLHIVRVLEREGLARTAFSDAQVQIREKIRQERTKKLVDEYVAKLKKDFPVWTILERSARKSEPPLAGAPRGLPLSGARIIIYIIVIPRAVRMIRSLVTRSVSEGTVCVPRLRFGFRSFAAARSVSRASR